MAKKKKYIPPKKLNPVVIAHRIEDLNERYGKLQKIQEAKYKSLENLVSLLVNFASHDFKNAVHSLDGITSLITVENFTKDDIVNIKHCVDHIRNTLDSFNELNLSKNISEFELSKIFHSIQILYRPYFKENKINYSVEYFDNTKNLIIKNNFNITLHIFCNLTINSIHALKDKQDGEIFVKVYRLNDTHLKINFCDNGCGIEDNVKTKIFNRYFTTKSDGSGIGLTHIRFFLDEMKNAEIKLLDNTDDKINTIFEIIIPIITDEAQDINN